MKRYCVGCQEKQNYQLRTKEKCISPCELCIVVGNGPPNNFFPVDPINNSL